MNDYTTELYRLLSREYNCSPDAFTKNENIVTSYPPNAPIRGTVLDDRFFRMVTLGNNAVITADERLHPFLRGFVWNRLGYWLFELPNLLPLEKKLNLFGYTLTQTNHQFLPCKAVEPKQRIPVSWHYDADVLMLDRAREFTNAVQLPDISCRRIAVCALDGDKIIGIAACHESTPRWMQIGIDVMPDYRSRGIGTYLVTLLKNRILEQKDIPYYDTSVSNYHSWNIAISCGFKPAWLEIGAVQMNRL